MSDQFYVRLDKPGAPGLVLETWEPQPKQVVLKERSYLNTTTSLPQPLNQRLPLLIKRSPVKPPPRPFIPIVSIPRLTLLAMQVCVHRHPLRRFKLIHQRVRSRPVPFRIPPQGSQRRRQLPRWLFKAQSRSQLVGSHTTFVPPTFLGFPNYSFATNVA
jgi:hypothetical protein